MLQKECSERLHVQGLLHGTVYLKKKKQTKNSNKNSNKKTNLPRQEIKKRL